MLSQGTSASTIQGQVLDISTPIGGWKPPVYNPPALAWEG